jgi:ParB-like chromosome segregation protein Spo0J
VSSAMQISESVSEAKGSMTRDVLVREVTAGGGIRRRGIDQDHVKVLAELDGNWPPIVVWGPRNQVIDGCHRVAAAKLLGHARIQVVEYEGSAEDAYLESVRRNIAHGLPLSLEDRRDAVRRVLSVHPEWSDRRIASLCNLSGKTVARLRDELGRTSIPGPRSAGLGPVERREGKDGRLRPVRAEALHDRILSAIEENPSGSLRSIAAVADASPETVRTVRARLLKGGSQPGSAAAVKLIDVGEASPNSSDTDDALSCIEGSEFAAWFRTTSVSDPWERFVEMVPMSRIYGVADEARRRAETWTKFARALEARVSGPRSLRA